MLNDAYEILWDKLKNSQKVRPYIATAKAAVTITNKVGTLPVGFDTINLVSTADFTIESDIELNDSRFFEFEVR